MSSKMYNLKYLDINVHMWHSDQQTCPQSQRARDHWRAKSTGQFRSSEREVECEIPIKGSQQDLPSTQAKCCLHFF